MHYRSDIDGLRAVAVLSVIAFHYGLGLSGGFIGVDVFFVISGYLITGKLVEERVSLASFYAGRIRRIFPAMLVLLLVTVATGYWFLPPGDYAAMGTSAAYAALSAANFYFLWNTGYFDQAADLQPLIHMWSLAVEEQFYLAWPLLIVALRWLGRGRKAVCAAAISLAILASFAASVQGVEAGDGSAFYLPHTRAWELGLGGLLVFLPVLRLPQLAIEAARIAGLAMIVAATILLTRESPFPGLNALAPCIGTALILWPSQARSSASTALGAMPLRAIGPISYSLYLWHWPLLVFFRFYNNGAAPTVWESLALAAGSFVLATLSYRFVEQPFRRHRLPARVTLPGGVALAAGVAACGFAVAAQEGFPQRIAPEAQALRSLDVMWAWQCPRFLKLDELRLAHCDFGVPWESAKTKALLWGDSHADHMAPILEAAAKDLPLSVLLYTHCPAALGRQVFTRASGERYPALCADMRERALALLKRDPAISLVVLSASWTALAATVLQDGSLPRLSGVQLVEQGLRTFLAQAAAPSRRFILIGDIPQLEQDPIPCALIATSTLLRRQCPPGQTSISRERFRARQGPTYDALTRLARERKDVDLILPGEVFCKEGMCQTSLDGEFLYRDFSHIRRNLSAATRRHYADMIGLTRLVRGDAR